MSIKRHKRNIIQGKGSCPLFILPVRIESGKKTTVLCYNMFSHHCQKLVKLRKTKEKEGKKSPDKINYRINFKT